MVIKNNLTLSDLIKGSFTTDVTTLGSGGFEDFVTIILWPKMRDDSGKWLQNYLKLRDVIYGLIILKGITFYGLIVKKSSNLNKILCFVLND